MHCHLTPSDVAPVVLDCYWPILLHMRTNFYTPASDQNSDIGVGCLTRSAWSFRAVLCSSDKPGEHWTWFVSDESSISVVLNILVLVALWPNCELVLIKLSRGAICRRSRRRYGLCGGRCSNNQTKTP